MLNRESVYHQAQQQQHSKQAIRNGFQVPTRKQVLPTEELTPTAAVLRPPTQVARRLFYCPAHLSDCNMPLLLLFRLLQTYKYLT